MIETYFAVRTWLTVAGIALFGIIGIIALVKKWKEWAELPAAKINNTRS